MRSAVAMVSDLDIWRAANLLIRKHGANAELEAAKRADLMLDRGDDRRPSRLRYRCPRLARCRRQPRVHTMTIQISAKTNIAQ